MRKLKRGVIARVVTLICAVTICVVTAGAQTFTILHTFEATKGLKDGRYPMGSLIWGPGGTLYGTTDGGGGTANAGTVFQVSPSGQESVLYSFRAAPDGKAPQAAVTLGSDGALYGTTNLGGSAGDGTVFKLEQVNGTYQETFQYSFQGGTDGAGPSSSVVFDEAGNLYGTTFAGGGTGCQGEGCGTVFKIDPSGQETILYAFGNLPDGESPYAGLIIDSAGNLYGTTTLGGADNKGTVFMVSPSGQETILHNFAGSPDGFAPYAALFRDAAGNLFGTTEGGGDEPTGCYGQGCGTVFEITSAGQEEVLYSFFNWRDEGDPLGGVVEDKAGNLYGTTLRGTDSLVACSIYGRCGTVFMLSPKGNLTTLYRFTDDGDGALPEDSLIMDASGNLYGTTRGDGRTGSYGNVFEITP
jgi:uncharacterized repeat protein (TIGR03803 family)